MQSRPLRLVGNKIVADAEGREGPLYLVLCRHKGNLCVRRHASLNALDHGEGYQTATWLAPEEISHVRQLFDREYASL